MTRHSADPDNPVQRGKWPKNGQRPVYVAFERSEVDYLLKHMATDDIRLSTTGKPFGAATVVRHIVLSAIKAHKSQATKVSENPGWPSKAQLMAGKAR